MASLYNIYIVPKEGVTEDEIQAKMNKALDWFRYDDKCWLVYTSSDQDKWYVRLSPLVKPGGHALIWRLSMSHYKGWMTNRLWEWIRKCKSRKKTGS
jgi:hypothetical protein